MSEFWHRHIFPCNECKSLHGIILLTTESRVLLITCEEYGVICWFLVVHFI